MNLTSVANKYLHRKNIKQVVIGQINKRKIEVRSSIAFSKHQATICFSATIVHDIIAAFSVEPSAFDLHAQERLRHRRPNHKVIGLQKVLTLPSHASRHEV